jgi:hypothetical protein
MTTSDKKKTSILVLLLLVAGLSWYFMNRPAGTSANLVSKGSVKPKAAGNANQEAQIHIELVSDTSGVNIGQKNLFSYRQQPVAVKPPEPVRQVPPQPNPPMRVDQLPVQQQAPPPWKAFRYEGFSLAKGGKPLGSISEGGTTYEVKEGDCMMGQYCVTRLTETIAEIDDLQLKRKQTFTRVQQP